MEFSNVLMGIAVIAVVLAGVNVIMVSTDLSSTGRASTDTGTTNVEIASAVNIRFNVVSLDWGKGTVGPLSATLDSVGTVPSDFYDVNWVPDGVDGPTLTGGLELENWGNVDVDLSLSATGGTNTFICNGDATCIAASPAFNWQLEDIEVGSCTALDKLTTAWTALTTVPTTPTLVCGDFNWAGTTNTIEIDFQLVIPVSAPVGQRQETITASAVISV